MRLEGEWMKIILLKVSNDYLTCDRETFGSTRETLVQEKGKNVSSQRETWVSSKLKSGYP